MAVHTITMTGEIMSTINELLTEYYKIQQAIEDAGGEITPEVEALFDGNRDQIETKLDGYADFITFVKGEVEALTEKASQVAARKKSQTSLIAWLRSRAHAALVTVEEKKIKTAEHTFSRVIRVGRKLAMEHATDKDIKAMLKNNLGSMEFRPDAKAISEFYKDKDVDFLVGYETDSITIR